MPTISTNVARILNVLGIQGVQIFDESRPDRVFAWDTKRQMAVECLVNRTHWMLDFHDPLHGKSTRESFREKTRPSMQCCFHEISQIAGTATDRYFLELDFDEAPPSNPETIFIHAKEVIVNALTGELTNQDDIARRLDERLKALDA
jgi:hypothetical protein